METVVAHVLSQKKPMEMVELRRAGSVSPEIPTYRFRSHVVKQISANPEAADVANSSEEAGVIFDAFFFAVPEIRLALVGAIMEGGSFSGRRRRNSAKFGETGKRSEIQIWMKGELNERELGESLGIGA